MTRPGEARLVAVVLAGGRGSRLPPSGPWGKHLEPVAGRPLVDHVLDRLDRVDEVVVAVGHRAAAMEHHLRARQDAGRGPRARTVHVRSIDDPAGAVDDCSDVAGDATVVVLEGDVLVPWAATASYLEAVRRSPPAGLALLCGPKEPRAHRCTLDLDADGAVRAVRQTRPDDPQRLSVLAAAPGPAARGRVRALATGGGWPAAHCSLWHHAAGALLEEGHPVTATLAPSGGVNVNTLRDLAEAARFLTADSAPRPVD